VNQESDSAKILLAARYRHVVPLLAAAYFAYPTPAHPASPWLTLVFVPLVVFLVVLFVVVDRRNRRK
jgi:hypothetical protein